MAGRAIFTIDESSVVMKAADPDNASTAHLLARSSVSTGVGTWQSVWAWRVATCASREQVTTSAWYAATGGAGCTADVPPWLSVGGCGGGSWLIESTVQVRHVRPLSLRIAAPRCHGR